MPKLNVKNSPAFAGEPAQKTIREESAVSNPPIFRFIGSLLNNLKSGFSR
jgi:hypothetical protein